MMNYKEFSRGRVFFGSLNYESDIVKEVENFAAGQDIDTAKVHIIGALKKVVLAYYDQKSKEYKNITIEKPLEIAQCGGSVTLKDNKANAHLHITLSDENGDTVAGHLMEGSVVFAGEMYFEELRGEPLHRTYDEVTGLFLWDFTKQYDVEL